MRLFALISMLALAACGPSNEIDNPRFFRVMAEHHKPGGQVVYEDVNARMRCTSWTCHDTPNTCTDDSCDEPNCECDGSYRLVGSQGLTFKFHGIQGIARGQSSTEDGTMAVQFEGEAGVGRVTVSRSRLLAFGLDDYALDMAGGFTVRVGTHAFVRGFFYSLPIEGE